MFIWTFSSDSPALDIDRLVIIALMRLHRMCWFSCTKISRIFLVAFFVLTDLLLLQYFNVYLQVYLFVL